MNEATKCRCNVCSSHISFDRADAGLTVTCPHCGMDTMLYVPPEPTENAPLTKTFGASELDPPFFDDGTVTVTKTRFVVGSQIIALSGVTSVAATEVAPKKLWPIGTLVLAFILIPFPLAAAVVAIISIIWLFLQKPLYAVVLNTSGGELKALTNPDKNYVAKVITALNSAIIARG